MIYHHDHSCATIRKNGNYFHNQGRGEMSWVLYFCIVESIKCNRYDDNNRIQSLRKDRTGA